MDPLTKSLSIGLGTVVGIALLVMIVLLLVKVKKDKTNKPAKEPPRYHSVIYRNSVYPGSDHYATGHDRRMKAYESVTRVD